MNIDYGLITQHFVQTYIFSDDRCGYHIFPKDKWYSSNEESEISINIQNVDPHILSAEEVLEEREDDEIHGQLSGSDTSDTDTSDTSSDEGDDLRDIEWGLPYYYGRKDPESGEIVKHIPYDPHYY